MPTLAALCFLAVIALPLTRAAQQTVDEFCADLSAVDSHLTLNFNAFFNVNLTTPYECVCNTTLLDTLVVDCLGMYDYADAFQTSREQAILKANNGTYTLIQTAWSDTFYDSINIFQGIYFFQNGELVSCSMTGCASCSICPDDSSIAVDCSTLAVGFEYTYACSNQYMGAFLSSFDFQIVQDPSEPPSNASNLLTIGEFCADLSDLEGHLKALFDEVVFEIPSSAYVCFCSVPDDDAALVIDCTLTYEVDGDSFVNVEHAVLEPSSGGTALVLAMTAWGDSMFVPTPGFQETFQFEAGILNSCEATSCISCGICPSGDTVSIDCSNLADDISYVTSCEELYTGSFMNTYEFALASPVNNTSPPTVPAISPTAGPAMDVPRTLAPSPSPRPPAEPQTTEDFCADLSDLEAHMKSSFEATVIALPVENNYECECSSPADAAMLPNCTVRYGFDVCSTPDNFALIIDCSLFYGDGETFINFEQAIFEKSSNGTMLDLERTGWGDTSIGISFQEFFFFENGSLNECFERSGAGVCTVCPDGESVSICSEVLEASCDIPCSEMYTGAFFNTYSFALLAAPTDMMAPTGSPLMAAAPMDTMSPTSSPTVAPTSSGSPVMADATTASPTLAPTTALAAAQGPTSGSSALQPVIGCLMLVATTLLFL